MIQDYTSGMFAACGIPQPDPHTVATLLDRECGDDAVLRDRFVVQRWPLMAEHLSDVLYGISPTEADRWENTLEDVR